MSVISLSLTLAPSTLAARDGTTDASTLPVSSESAARNTLEMTAREREERGREGGREGGRRGKGGKGGR